MIYLDSTVENCVSCGGGIESIPDDNPYYEEATCLKCGYSWIQPRPQDDDFSSLLKERAMTKTKTILTEKQKIAIINYVMNYSKGIAEDVDEMWEEMTQDQIDENYESVESAAEEYIEELKRKMLQNL